MAFISALAIAIGIYNAGLAIGRGIVIAAQINKGEKPKSEHSLW